MIIVMNPAEADRRRGDDRATVARAIARHPHRGLVFAALDGRSVVPGAWSAIRPEAARPYPAGAQRV